MEAGSKAHSDSGWRPDHNRGPDNKQKRADVGQQLPRAPEDPHSKRNSRLTKEDLKGLVRPRGPGAGGAGGGPTPGPMQQQAAGVPNVAAGGQHQQQQHGVPATNKNAQPTTTTQHHPPVQGQMYNPPYNPPYQGTPGHDHIVHASYTPAGPNPGVVPPGTTSFVGGATAAVPQAGPPERTTVPRQAGAPQHAGGGQYVGAPASHGVGHQPHVPWAHEEGLRPAEEPRFSDFPAEERLRRDAGPGHHGGPGAKHPHDRQEEEVRKIHRQAAENVRVIASSMRSEKMDEVRGKF